MSVDIHHDSRPVGQLNAKPGHSSPHRQVVIASLLFSLGFTLVFVALGATAGAAGQWLIHYRNILSIIAGTIIILLGLFAMGAVKIHLLYHEFRFRTKPSHAQPATNAQKPGINKLRRFKVFAAPLAGMAFAFGWTPCVGPFLGSLLLLAADSGTASRGALYLAVYSAGLALPFILSAVLLASLVGAFAWLKKRMAVLNVIAGVFLVGTGILLILGRFGELTSVSEHVTSLLYRHLNTTDPTLTALANASVGIVTSFAAGLLSFLSPCVLPLVPGYLSFISGTELQR